MLLGCWYVYSQLQRDQHSLLRIMYVTTFTPLTSTLFRSQSASNSTASILTHQPKKLPAPKIQRRYSDGNFFPIPQYSSDMPRDKAIFAFMIFSTMRLQISSMIFRPCIITPGQTAIFHQLHDETPCLAGSSSCTSIHLLRFPRLRTIQCYVSYNLYINSI
ncbi:hypothetical protein FOCG_10663 [Fusarium oxysporum f. sp. radicis-lycopersici 26381]|nr:hypothetical protein FOCG_10663 [Fusarium oxysporum f. sp. radicis-lycopersici 26381]